MAAGFFEVHGVRSHVVLNHLERRSLGFPAVPSDEAPAPGADPYFSGGYNTERHTCGARAAAHGGSPGGGICGGQLEANYAGVRDDAKSRRLFGEATAAALEAYLRTHWAIPLAPSG